MNIESQAIWPIMRENNQSLKPDYESHEKASFGERVKKRPHWPLVSTISTIHVSIERTLGLSFNP